MEIEISVENGTALLALTGRFDTIHAGKVMEALEKEIEKHKNVTLDFAGVDYMASAGLRALLTAEEMARLGGGVLAVRNVGTEVMDIFDITGFTEILTIL